MKLHKARYWLVLSCVLSLVMGLSAHNTAWGSECFLRPANFTPPDPLLERVLAIDPESLRALHAKDHFQNPDPLVFREHQGDSASLRVMTVNFEHLLPSYYDKKDYYWPNKLVFWGKTFRVADADIISANEVYPEGIQEFGGRILRPLGYEWVMHVDGGKLMLGSSMNVALIYKKDKFKVLESESHSLVIFDAKGNPMSVKEARDRTRGILRVTLQMQIGSSELTVYVVHFKSGRPLNTPIPLPDGSKSIQSSNELRWHQMEHLRRLVQADLKNQKNVIVMGDFNTGFAEKDLVNPDDLSQKEYDIRDDDRGMIASAQSITDLVENEVGRDLFSDVDGYSHVYKGDRKGPRGNKLDHMLMFPVQRGPSDQPILWVRVENRKILRYPWQLQLETRYPRRFTVSDHLPLLADVIIPAQNTP